MTERRSPRNPSQVPIDLRRRPDAKLLVSRIAADLFWREGVASTRGEDIAEAAGISTRTLWRYFRSKESCVEPVLVESGRHFLQLMSTWPPELSVEAHLGAYMAGPAADQTTEQTDDDSRAIQMIALGMTEPAIRSAWLAVCDDAERAMVGAVAQRLGESAEELEVRQIAAAVTAAVRVVNDEISVAATTGARPVVGDEVLTALARAVRQASNGRLGDPVATDPTDSPDSPDRTTKETTR